jgi:hypothetical protein
MLNLSPNTQKPTVYTNFLLGSRTCFFPFLGRSFWASEGVWVLVLGSHFAFHLYSEEIWHGTESLFL